MFRDHPLIGVGADNFGIAFNQSRARAAAVTPVNEEIAEDLVLERAHNEVLQVFDELGVAGGIVFLLAFGVFAFGVFERLRRGGWRFSPMLWAALGAMTAFAGSSMVSSFSFRVVQNALAFFAAFAVALYEMSKPATVDTAATGKSVSLRGIAAVAAAAALAMLVYTGTKACGEYYLSVSEGTERFEDADRAARTSLQLDPGNAAAYYYLASRYANEGDYAKASELMSQAIDRGLGVSLTYHLLAKYRSLSGDTAGAEGSLATAVDIFPRSVFLRVRYAALLEDLGRTDLAAKQMEIARNIDSRQSNGWYNIIRQGSVAAFYNARSDPGIAPPAELIPENVVLDYLDRPDFTRAPAD
jgi:tetratricopeptide (TPR) repeat protein